MEWKEDAVRAVRSFDEALGRPPFPTNPSQDLVYTANSVLTTLQGIVDAGKLSTLQRVPDITTTLPVLCASLKAGSPEARPSLELYRPMLVATGLAASLSTYPISSILQDAKEVLGGWMYGGGASSSAATSKEKKTMETSMNSAVEEEELNEAALFSFMAHAKCLTADDMRMFLRVPPQPPAATAASAGHSKGKGKDKKSAATANKPTSTTNPAATAGTLSCVPRRVLDQVLRVALSDECQRVLESFMDNTQKFLDVVGSDGDLASRILDIYGARVIPKLGPSSLLPCLDASLLDYYVDLIAHTQLSGRQTLLTSRELLDAAGRSWDGERMRRLAQAAASRSLQFEDAAASLLVYVFLYRVYSEGTDSAGTDGAEQQLGETERALLVAIARALEATLANQGTSRSDSAASPAQVFAQPSTGILVVRAASVPLWLSAFSAFATVLLARPSVVALCLSESRGEDMGEKWGGEKSGRGTVQSACSLVTESLQVLLRALTAAAPKPEPKAPGAAGKSRQPSTQQQNTSKKGGEKTSKAVVTQPSTESKAHVSDSAVEIPVALSELLALCCSSLSCAAILQHAHHMLSAVADKAPVRDADAAAASSCCALFRSYAYLLHHQSQHMNASLWLPFLDFITLHLWLVRRETDHGEGGMEAKAATLCRSPADGAAEVPQDAVTTVLHAATADTDMMLWLSPLLLGEGVESRLVNRTATELFAADHGLWRAVVHAAVTAQNRGERVSSALHRYLHPTSAAVLVGCFSAAVSETVLEELAASLVTSNTNDGSGAAVVAAQLQRMQQECSGESERVFRVPFTGDEVYASAASSGLQRLCDVLDVMETQHRALLRESEELEKAMTQREMHARLMQSQALAAAHRAFREAAEAKRASKAAEQAAVHAEVTRRRAEAAARFRDDAAARARKRQVALETMRARAAQTRAERAAQRDVRFAAYRQRLESEYRVSAFLEHLNLTPACVMATRDALRKVMDRISPDDLLEYLVCGVAQVPADMADDNDDEETAQVGREDIAEEHSRRTTTPSASTTIGTAAESVVHASPHGERRDFWAEVMDNATQVPEATPAPISKKPAAAGTDPSQTASAAAYSKQSFHRRLSPLLDLFFYEDGDEYGNVPDVLPVIRLRTAASVWTPARVQQQLGFANLREAFMVMERRGLVQLRDGLAQLTLLGFRYHFPFHNPNGMLEVHLREARERVRALVARHAALRGPAEDAEGEVNDEEDCEEEDEEDFTSGDDDYADRLLPEVEFGI